MDRPEPVEPPSEEEIGTAMHGTVDPERFRDRLGPRRGSATWSSDDSRIIRFLRNVRYGRHRRG